MIRPNDKGKPDIEQPSSIFMSNFELPKIAVKSTNKKATRI